MKVDIDLIQKGQWTEALLQADIAEQDIIRAQLYGIYDDTHIRSLQGQPGHYEILGSPKTWLIAQLIQQSSIPVKLMDHLDSFEVNGYYTPVEIKSDHFIDRARELQVLIDRQHLSLTDAGKLIGKSRSEVCNLMRILKMDDRILKLIKGHARVGFGHAKIMAGLKYEHQRILIERIKYENLTVQQAEMAAKELRENLAPTLKKSESQEKSEDVLRLERMLTEHFGAQVVINEKDSLLEINYHKDLDILQGILDKIGIIDL